MKVHFVGAGPGNPDLLTIRAHRLLGGCSICIYAGSLVSPEVIACVNKQALMYDSAVMNLDQIITVCKDAAEKNIDVLRLHTGDPSIFGAIGEQIAELDRFGIGWEIVPGVSSFQAAAAAIGVELTMPEVSQTIVLTRTAGRTPMPELQTLDKYAATGATLCIFLSVHGVEKVAEELQPHYGKECPAAVVYHASWPDEVVIRGTLENIAKLTKEKKIGKTALIIAGQALGEHSSVSKLYDRTFTHGYRRGDSA